MIAVRAKNIVKSFGTPPVDILKNISVEIPEGAFTSVTGRSGSGKSTLLYVLSTLDQATSGEVEIFGMNTLAMNDLYMHKLRNERMGFVFQFHHLIPELNAIENVLIPARKHSDWKKRIAYAEKLFKDFDLTNRKQHFPSQLSGGEQQRVAIARALVMEPKIVFADEPTGNLDPVNGGAVMELFKKFSREKGTTVIYVTHDEQFAALASLRIQLVDGELV